MRRSFGLCVLVAATLLLFSVLSLGSVIAAPGAAAPDPIQVTILHTNDFHGRLEPDSSGRGGSTYMAPIINDLRTSKGEENVLLLDAGDSMLAAPPISQLVDGESVMDIYNRLGYDVSTFGNHEFDKGETVLISRTNEAAFPFVSANIINTGSDWVSPDWAQPFVTLTVGSGDNTAVLGIIGLTTDETPIISRVPATVEFKDPTAAVLQHYDTVKAQSDAVIVLAHIGTNDVGAIKGLTTIATELQAAGKSVPLIIGGHAHESLFSPVVVGDTTIVQAGYYGRWIGKVDVTIDPATDSLTVDASELITVSNSLPVDADIQDRVAYWADFVAPFLNQPVGETYVSLVRNYNDESLLGDLVADSMVWKADMLDDGEVNGTVDIGFTNAGGLRADIAITEGVSRTITWGDTFSVLPFGNVLSVMDLTGAQIQALLNQAASLYKGILQSSSGIRWSWYNDTGDATPTKWRAMNVWIHNEPLDPLKTYRVVTNDFLAQGLDGFVTFASGTNRADYLYADMQEALNEYIINVVNPIDVDDIPSGRITRWETLYEALMPQVYRNALNLIP